jgi:hypothetical protein
MGDGDGEDDDDDDEDDEDFIPPENHPPSEEQKQAVQHVMSCKETNQSRKMLGVLGKGKYDTPEVEKQEILKAFRNVGMLTHDGFNSSLDATDAFQSKRELFFTFDILC